MIPAEDLGNSGGSEFVEFSGKWEKHHPAIIRLWENAWAEFAPCMRFDREIRTVRDIGWVGHYGQSGYASLAGVRGNRKASGYLAARQYQATVVTCSTACRSSSPGSCSSRKVLKAARNLSWPSGPAQACGWAAVPGVTGVS
jgi:hypothetical protein